LGPPPDEVVFPVPRLVRAGLAVLDSGAGGGLFAAGGVFNCLVSVAEDLSARRASSLQRLGKKGAGPLAPRLVVKAAA